MHTLDKLQRAIAAVEKLGYRVRQEWLGGSVGVGGGNGGSGGGGCEIRGQKWLFLDLAQSPAEQLDIVVEVLRRETADRESEQAKRDLRKSA